MAEEVAAEYKTSLEDLTFNSKPVINMLTMVAEDNIEHAQEITNVIEERIMKAPANRKLPVLYLIDSIIKNVRDKRYLDLFSNKIVEIFAAVFQKVDEKTRQALYKLRQTWTPLFQNKRMYALDHSIAKIDPAWPITAKSPEAVSIHVNPKFLNPKKPASPEDEQMQKLQKEKEEALHLQQQKLRAETLQKTQEEQKKLEAERARRDQESAEVLIREQLLSKQQELIQLQQEQLQLDLAEAKAKLDHQTRQLQFKEQQMKQQLLAQLQQNASRSQQSDAKPKEQPPLPTLPPVSNRDPRSRRDPRLVTKDTKSSTPAVSQLAVVHPNKHTTQEDRTTPDRKAPQSLQVKPDEKKSKSPPKPAEVKKNSSPVKPAPKTPERKPVKVEDKSSTKVDSRNLSKKETTQVNYEKQKSPVKESKLSKAKVNKSEKDTGRKTKDVREDREKTSGVRTTRESLRRSKEKGRSSDPVEREKTRFERPQRNYRKQVSPSPEHNPVADRKRTRGRARSPSMSRSTTRSRSRSPLFQSRSKGRNSQNLRHPSDRRDNRGSTRGNTQHKGDTDRKYASDRKSTGEVNKRGESLEKSDRESGPPKKKVRQTEEDMIKEDQDDGVDDQGKLTGELAELFGKEDKDYRRLPPIPKISTNLPTPDDGLLMDLMSPSAVGWSKFKATHPDEFPFAQPRTNETIHRQTSVTRFRTPLQSPPVDSDGYARQLVHQDSDQTGSTSIDSAGDILEQAEQQLRTGKLTYLQHEELLHQLTELQNLQKMKQQLREENKMISEAKPTPENLKTIKTGFLKRSMLGSPPRMSLSPGHDQQPQGEESIFNRERKFKVEDEDQHNLPNRTFQGPEYEGFDGMKQEPHFDSRHGPRGPDYRPVENMHEQDTSRPGSNQSRENRSQQNRPNIHGNERHTQDSREMHMERGPRKPLLETPDDRERSHMFREPRNSSGRSPQQHDADPRHSGPSDGRASRSYKEERYQGPDVDSQGRAFRPPGRSGPEPHNRSHSGSFPGPPDQHQDLQLEPHRGPASHPRSERPQGSTSRPFQRPESEFNQSAESEPMANQSFGEMDEDPHRLATRRDSKMSDPGMGQGMYTKDQRHKPVPVEEAEASGRPLTRSESFEPLAQPWYDTDLIYCPTHDARWIRRVTSEKDRDDLLFVIVGPNLRFQVPHNFQGRKIKLGRHNEYLVRMDYDHRQRRLYLDRKPFYKIGEEPKLLTLGKGKYEAEYLVHMEGMTKNVWIDEVQYQLHRDAPQELIHFSNRDHRFQIDTLRNMVVVDGHDICPADGPPKKIQLAYVVHTIQFDPPPKHILIDGNLCELDLVARFPLVIMGGKPHGIRFDGPPRRMLINDVVHTVHMDKPRKAKILGNKPYLLAFGGPGHEVIIENNWYEVKFGEPPKHIKIGARMCKIELPGRPPEVKILGEYVPVEQIISRVGHPGAPVVPQVTPQAPVSSIPNQQPLPGPALPGHMMPRPPMPQHSMPGQPTPGQPMPGQPMMMGQPMLQPPMPGPGQFNQPHPGMVPNQGARPGFMPVGRPDLMPGQVPGQPQMPGKMPEMIGQQQPQAAVAPAPAPINVNDLLSKLVSAGVITNKQDKPNSENRATPPPSESVGDEIEQEMVLRESVQEIPELLSFKADLLKKRYVGARQLLSVGIQCASCGLRFVPEHKVQYKEHLDWHFRQNKRGKDEMKVAKHRHWYYSVSDWIQYEEIGDLEQRQQSSYFEQAMQSAMQSGQRHLPGQGDFISCPAVSGEDDDVCGICGEAFEQFWDEDEEEWHLKDAIRAKNGKTYHPVCYEDINESNTSLMETESPEILGNTRPPCSLSEGGSTAPAAAEPITKIPAEDEVSSSDVAAPTVTSSSDKATEEYVPEAPPQLMDMINNPLGYLASLSKQMKKVSSAPSLETMSHAKPVQAMPTVTESKSGMTAKVIKPRDGAPSQRTDSGSNPATVITPVLNTTTSVASAAPPRVKTPPTPPATVTSGDATPRDIPIHTAHATPPHTTELPPSGGGTPVRDEVEMLSGGCTPVRDEPAAGSGRGTPVEDEPSEPMDARMQVGSLYPNAASLVHVIAPLPSGTMGQHQDPAMYGIKQEVVDDIHSRHSPRS